jgi:anti-sigma B factor antagonist
MPFDVVRTTLDSGVIVLALSGSMTMGNQLLELERVVKELITGNQKGIVVDMSKVSYLDSSAIGALVACHSNMKNSGGQLRLAGVTPRVSTVFKMTGVDKVLSLDPTREDSVSALSAGA